MRCLLFLFVENRKRILPHKRTDFVTFALRRSDCSLAGSFLSEAVLSGRTERLTQGNKTVLLCGKIVKDIWQSDKNKPEQNSSFMR